MPGDVGGRLSAAMTFGAKRAFLLGAALAAVTCPAVVPAQSGSAPSAREDPSSALSRHVRTLAESPNDLAALKGAARAALDLGDPEAALTFLARADADAPRDGEVKAETGSAMLQLEQPDAALRLFNDAARFGAPPALYAADRGLAYDLTGDQRRAQADYALALQAGENDEVRRRLALSVAIGGDRERALAMLDAQLRRQDRAAWRARAFILALTGDSAGATDAVRAVLPGEAEAMAPFLARLPSLKPAERAMAVNFGRFPGDKPPVQIASAAVPRATRSSHVVADSGEADRRRSASVMPPAEALSTEPRRRPGASAAEANPAPPRAEVSPVETAQKAATAAPRKPEVKPFGLPTPARHSALADMAMMLQQLSDPVSAPHPAAEAEHRKSGHERTLLSDTDELKLEPRADKAKAADKTSAKPETADKTASRKKKAEPPSPKAPSRIWVQIAGGANKDDLPKEFARQKDKASKLLGGRIAYTTPLHATNRLLVGPFKTDDEAQDYINSLKKKGLKGFSWTSAKGQEIEKLPGK